MKLPLFFFFSLILLSSLVSAQVIIGGNESISGVSIFNPTTNQNFSLVTVNATEYWITSSGALDDPLDTWLSTFNSSYLRNDGDTGNGDYIFNNNITADYFIGNGSRLTSVCLSNGLGCTQSSIQRIHLKKASATEDINDGDLEIKWDSEAYIDTNVYNHSTTYKPHQIKVLEEGLYNIKGKVVATNLGTNRFSAWAYVKVNNVTQNTTRGAYYSRGVGFGNYMTMEVDTILSLSINDTIVIWVVEFDSEQATAVNTIVANSEMIITKLSNTPVGNTWRGIDQVPVNLQVDNSISSAWAYNHELEGYYNSSYLRNDGDTGTALNLTGDLQVNGTLLMGATPSVDFLTSITNNISTDNSYSEYNNLNIVITDSGDTTSAFSEPLLKGAYIQASKTGDMTATLGDIRVRGMDMIAQFTGDISNNGIVTVNGFVMTGAFGGTITSAGRTTIRGGTITSTGNIGTANVVSSHEGIRITSRGTADNNYGIYIATVTEATNNYGIFDVSGADWVLAGDNQKIFQGGGQDVSTDFNSTDSIENAEVGTPSKFWTNFKKYIFDNDVEVQGNLEVTKNITGNQIYGELWGSHIGDVVINSMGVYENVTNTTQTYGNGFTNSSGILTAQKSGIYKITSQWSFSDGANTEFHLSLNINGTQYDKCHAERKVGTGGDVGSSSFTCLISLDQGNYLLPIIENMDNTNDVTIHDLQLNIIRIGNK